MSWKNWPRWVRYELIGLTLAILLFVLKTIWNIISARKWLFDQGQEYIINYIHLRGLIEYIAHGIIITFIILILLYCLTKTKSWWIKWKYWLKGGILALIIHILFVIYIVILYLIKDYFAPSSEWWYGFGAGIMLYFGLILLIPAFIIGALIGWIYGKLKSGRKR